MIHDSRPREIGYANRSLLLLRPRAPMITWVQGCDPGAPISDEEVARATEAMMIPAFEVVADAWSWIEDNADALFEVALGAWYGDRVLWPERRDWLTLQEWFHLEIVDVLWDVVDAPLTSEPDGPYAGEPVDEETPDGEWN
jgi:hypothetical protein